jgi:hypothetical protein
MRRKMCQTLRKPVLVLFSSLGTCLVLLCAAALCEETVTPVSPQEHRKQPVEAQREDAALPLTFPYESGWSLTLSPETELYPRSIADPRRPGLAVTYGHYIRSEIPDAGNSRLSIRMGGSYGLLRLHPSGEPGRGLQLDAAANFLGQFDLDHSLDNIGWDGLYGLFFTWADGGGWALKFGAHHDSSHVGDEYAERIGRRRVGYTREETVLGVSRAFSRHWRLYGEAGRAYHRSNKELMDLWRGQLGLEYESPRRLWNGRMGWYAAADCSFFQENDWRGNIALQLGLVIPQEDIGRRYRFGVEYYRGRSVIGEFFQNDEASISVGFWWDL